MTNPDRPPSFFFGYDLRTLAPLPDGSDPYVALLDDWPQHITAFPPVTELPGISPEPLFADVREIVHRSPVPIVVPSHDALFASEQKVTVFDDLRHIHYALLGAVTAYGYADQYPAEYAGTDYNAHTSHMEGIVPPSAPIALTGLSVWRRNSAGQKYTFARYKFNTK